MSFLKKSEEGQHLPASLSLKLSESQLGEGLIIPSSNNVRFYGGGDLIETVNVPSVNNLYFEFDGEMIAQEIKQRRKQQGLSELELAELAGVSRSTIQKLESANMKVHFDKLKKVMSAVGLELAWR